MNSTIVTGSGSSIKGHCCCIVRCYFCA